MQRLLTHGWSWVAVVIIALLASCSKEECVKPSSDQPAGDAKYMLVSSVPDGSGKTGMKDGKDGTEGDGSGISDDGDDLSDSERSKKKKSAN